MRAITKRIAGALGWNRLSKSGYRIRPVDFSTDWPRIEELLAKEEWPLVRADLEISHDQPVNEFLVADDGDTVNAFFATHAFGKVGYLDVMIVAEEARRSGIARPLYFQAVRNLKRQRIKSLIVHTTNDSARLIRLLGFRPGQSFTLLAKEPGAVTATGATTITRLGLEELPALIALDEQVFCQQRPEWLTALVQQEANEFYGLRDDGQLAAALCLRRRKAGAVCIDGANAVNSESLASLVQGVVQANTGRRIESFVRTNGKLHSQLVELGFTVPDFFVEIGPLVEWRKGRRTDIGTGPRIETLNWF